MKFKQNIGNMFYHIFWSWKILSYISVLLLVVKIISQKIKMYSSIEIPNINQKILTDIIALLKCKAA